VRRAAALPLTLGLLLAIAPAADALSLRATAHERGRIALRVQAQPGVELTVRDELTGEQRTLAPSAQETVLRRFAVWSCAGAVRRFTVTQGADTATAQVRTPTCAHRMTVAAPRVSVAPRGVAVRLRDRWRLGDFAVRFCVRPPGASERCRSVEMPSGRHDRVVRFRALRPGAYALTAAMPYQRLRRTLRARPPGGRLRILATGDSMIQIVDIFLKKRLGGGGPARVRSDAHISTGISKPSLLDWQAQARRQAAGRPDVVVMFLGANDGFPMGDAACCNNDAWISEYARRAREMMRSYGRGGRTRVYWLLLPTPRGGFFRETFPAVNAAIRRAAATAARDVRVIDLVEVFTPGGRYRDSMPVGGRKQRVRQGDGVHLNTTGASVAANVIIRTLRRERILR
jgi:lysophospholipase L1-like esterase